MKKNESIHDRISQMVDYYGNGKNTVFAKLVGESEANVRGYRINVIPKQPFLEKVVRCLDVSPRWLLTGEGSMLRDGRPEPTPIAPTEPPDAGHDPVYKELLAEMRAEHRQEIAAKDREINELNRKLGAVEARLGERHHTASLEFSGGLSEVLIPAGHNAESPSKVSTTLVERHEGRRPTSK